MVKGRQIEREVVEEKEPSKPVKKVATTPETPKKMSADAFLEAVTGISVPVEKKTAKKNGIPTINLQPEIDSLEEVVKKEQEEAEANGQVVNTSLTDQIEHLKSVRKAVDEIVAAKKAMKEAKAVLETKEAEVIGHVLPIYEQDGMKGDFHKSYYVAGETNTVTFVTADKFSAPKNEEIPELQEALGDKFDEVIKKETEIKLRPEIFTNKTLQSELMKLVPKERFGEFFAAETTWSVSDGFDQKRFSLPKKIYEKVMGILKQSKPSIK